MSLHRDIIAAPPASLKGVAFEIADLILAHSWAERYDLGMVIRLDHGAIVGEDYEEVIAFETQTRPLNRLFLWRNATAVFVQPLVGRARRYESVAAALESVVPAQDVVVTDIAVARWPAGRA